MNQILKNFLSAQNLNANTQQNSIAELRSQEIATLNRKISIKKNESTKRNVIFASVDTSKRQTGLHNKNDSFFKFSVDISKQIPTLIPKTSFDNIQKALKKDTSQIKKLKTYETNKFTKKEHQIQSISKNKVQQRANLNTFLKINQFTGVFNEINFPKNGDLNMSKNKLSLTNKNIKINKIKLKTQHKKSIQTEIIENEQIFKSENNQLKNRNFCDFYFNEKSKNINTQNIFESESKTINHSNFSTNKNMNDIDQKKKSFVVFLQEVKKIIIKKKKVEEKKNKVNHFSQQSISDDNSESESDFDEMVNLIPVEVFQNMVVKNIEKRHVKERLKFVYEKLFRKSSKIEDGDWKQNMSRFSKFLVDYVLKSQHNILDDENLNFEANRRFGALNMNFLENLSKKDENNCRIIDQFADLEKDCIDSKASFDSTLSDKIDNEIFKNAYCLQDCPFSYVINIKEIKYKNIPKINKRNYCYSSFWMNCINDLVDSNISLTKVEQIGFYSRDEKIFGKALEEIFKSNAQFSAVIQVLNHVVNNIHGEHSLLM